MRRLILGLSFRDFFALFRGQNSLVAASLPELGLNADDLLAMKSSRMEKQAIAWMLKKKTTVTVVWIAERLKMGHRTNASRAISSFDQSNAIEIEGLKDKVLQITG